MSLHIHAHDSATTFLQRAADFLEAREVEHNLVLGVAGQLLSAPADSAHDWLTVEDRGEVIGAAMRTQPHQPALSVMPDAAAAALAADFRRRGIPLDGVFGPSRPAECFVRAWAEGHNCRTQLAVPMWLYRCDHVSPSESGSHLIRPPVPADRAQIAAFLLAFGEAVETPLKENALEAADRAIARGSLLVGEQDGRLTCCAGVVRRTGRSAAIAQVFTLPSERGKGWATAVVARLTAQELAAGREFCCLYAHRENSSANRVYQRIGYRRVCPFDWWRFASLSMDQLPSV